MATEKILIFDEAGNAKRMKVRIARFLDNEPVTASDKENIRTTLDVDDSLSGTFTTPLSVTSASDSSFTGGGKVGIGTSSPIGPLTVQVAADKNLVTSTQYSGASLEAVNDAYSANIPLAIYGSPIRLLSGNVEVNSGNIVMGSSYGIDFGSTTTGTGTVTGGLLDDYETGTWEPYLSFGGGGTGITYGERLGYYTKIGDRVFVSGVITLTAVGSSTGTASLQGLPFTASNASSSSRDNLTFSYANGMTGLGGTVVAIIIPNQTYANLFQWAASGTSLINNTEFTNSTTIRFNGQYHV